MEKLTFQGEDGDQVEFYVLEQARVGGKNYLLVAESREEDAECLILKDIAKELEALLPVFEQLLEDVSIQR